VLERVARLCVLRRWHVLAVTRSPLTGPKGNREFFLHVAQSGRTAPDIDAQIRRAVEDTPT
jgi:predicted rRNA methylase YqxC with S4 and FtsJ domains